MMGTLTAPGKVPGREPTGTACDGCRGAVFSGWRTGDGALLFRCPDCNAIARRTTVAEVARLEHDPRAHDANTWPQSGVWTWVGFVRTRDGQWLKVGTADTLPELWDVLDASWLAGAKLAMPIRPAEQHDQDEDDFPCARKTWVEPPPPQERCSKCRTTTMQVRWRTLNNGRLALWSKCSTCGGGGRAMPHTPQHLAEASQRRRWEDA